MSSEMSSRKVAAEENGVAGKKVYRRIVEVLVVATLLLALIAIIKVTLIDGESFFPR